MSLSSEVMVSKRGSDGVSSCLQSLQPAKGPHAVSRGGTAQLTQLAHRPCIMLEPPPSCPAPRGSGASSPQGLQPRRLLGACPRRRRRRRRRRRQRGQRPILAPRRCTVLGLAPRLKDVPRRGAAHLAGRGASPDRCSERRGEMPEQQKRLRVLSGGACGRGVSSCVPVPAQRLSGPESREPTRLRRVVQGQPCEPLTAAPPGATLHEGADAARNT